MINCINIVICFSQEILHLNAISCYEKIVLNGNEQTPILLHISFANSWICIQPDGKLPQVVCFISPNSNPNPKASYLSLVEGTPDISRLFLSKARIYFC